MTAVATLPSSNVKPAVSPVRRPVFLTPDDLIADERWDHYELIDGIPVEKAMGAESSYVSTQFSTSVTMHLRQKPIARVFDAETGYTCFPKGLDYGRSNLRKPDVSVVLKDRLPGGKVPRGYFTIRPDIAFESISTGDLAYELRKKLRQYRHVQVPIIVVAWPISRVVEIERLGHPPVEVDETGEIDLGDVLPGLTIAVVDLLPPADEQEPPPPDQED